MAFVKPTIGRIRQDAQARGRRAGRAALRKQLDERDAARAAERSAAQGSVTLPRRAARSVVRRVRAVRAGTRES